MPALLTSTSIVPNRSSVALISASQSLQLPTWQATAIVSVPERLGDLVRQHLAVVELAAGDHHRGPTCGVRPADLPAEAPAAAGDDGHLAGEVEQIDGVVCGHRDSWSGGAGDGRVSPLGGSETIIDWLAVASSWPASFDIRQVPLANPLPTNSIRFSHRIHVGSSCGVIGRANRIVLSRLLLNTSRPNALPSAEAR